MDKKNKILFRKFTWLMGQEYSEVTEDDITVECFLIDQYFAGILHGRNTIILTRTDLIGLYLLDEETEDIPLT